MGLLSGPQDFGEGVKKNKQRTDGCFRGGTSRRRHQFGRKEISQRQPWKLKGAWETVERNPEIKLPEKDPQYDPQLQKKWTVGKRILAKDEDEHTNRPEGFSLLQAGTPGKKGP